MGDANNKDVSVNQWHGRRRSGKEASQMAMVQHISNQIIMMMMMVMMMMMMIMMTW